MENKYEFEVWSVIQELQPDEVATAIEDSDALVEAIRCKDWTHVADIVNKRVDTYARRIADIRVYDEVRTESVDSVQELEEYRVLRIMRQEEKLKQRREQMDKIQASFDSTFDE